MEADYVLDYDVISQAREHDLFLLARIRAERTTDGLIKRPPLNLSVVLDRSGSMEGDKLAYVKQAAQFLVQHLGAQDRFSLVTYDDNVQVEIAPGPVEHKDAFNLKIRRIHTGGMTNLSGGWLQGCQLVSENAAQQQVNRVLLLTDGLANRGVTDPDRLAAMARQKRDEGITTTTMGVGMDFNEDLLRRMATEGGGSFYFIDNPDLTPKIFSDELKDLLSVVGQNLIITVTLSADVQVVRQLHTYPSEVNGQQIIYRLGDLYVDEIKMLLLELHIPRLETLGQVEVARLRFEYDELAADSAIHRALDLPIVVNAVAADEAARSEPNREVVKTALLLSAARAREEAIQYADTGDYAHASETLHRAAEAIEQSNLDDDDLQQEHNMLREEAVDMEMGPERYDAYTRKTISTQSFMTSRLEHFAAEKAGLHARRKSAREAVERGGDTPSEMHWQKIKTLNLSGVDLVTIGREDDNDVVIEHAGVSAHHCVIRRRGDDLLLEDLSSTNGTFANGGRVKDPFRLSSGDVVTVGPVLFRFK